MATPLQDVRKLQASLAFAALALLECEEQRANGGKISLQPYQIAKQLGYEGAFDSNSDIRVYLEQFWTDNQGAR
jgi:hypothetical protein